FYSIHQHPNTSTYTLSLHDALPIFTKNTRRNRPEAARRKTASPIRRKKKPCGVDPDRVGVTLEMILNRQRSVRVALRPLERFLRDRKSTRLNSSHDQISYAVFCLKK